MSPLAALLPERASPEMLYLETKFASLVSYGLTVRLLGELLPLDQPIGAERVTRCRSAIDRSSASLTRRQTAGWTPRSSVFNRSQCVGRCSSITPIIAHCGRNCPRFGMRSMRWTPRGAHLLLQARTRVLNGDLDQLIRCRYPAFRPVADERSAPTLG